MTMCNSSSLFTTSLLPCAQGLSAIVHATCRDMAAKVVSHRIASGAQALYLVGGFLRHFNDG